MNRGVGEQIVMPDLFLLPVSLAERKGDYSCISMKDIVEAFLFSFSSFFFARA